MLNLIRKDFMILMKKYYFLLPMVAVTIGFGLASVWNVEVIVDGNTAENVVKSEVMRNLFHSLGALWVFILGVMSMIGSEEQSKTNCIIKSLPVKSDDIIKEKYLFSFLIFIIYIILSKLVGAVFLGVLGDFSLKGLDMGTCVVAGVLYFIMVIIYMPLYYKFGYMKMKYVNLILYLSAIMIPNLLTDWIKKFSPMEVRDFMEMLIRNAEIFKFVGILSLLTLGVLSLFISINSGKYFE